MPEIELESFLVSLSKSLPAMEAWVQAQAGLAHSASRPVSELGFSRLGLYFRPGFLASARVVVVDRVPVPPLRDLGLGELAEFLDQDFRAITYLDTYFVRCGEEGDEALHMHELIHVLQWRILGARTFLKSYAAGLAWKGAYKDNPFEDMAYRLQEKFESRYGFSAESEVEAALKDFWRESWILPG